MDPRSGKAASVRFRRQFGQGCETLQGLKNAAEQLGYTLIPFHHAVNSPAVDTVIRTLHLEQMTASAKGFTYADAGYRLIFIHRDLSEEEQRLVLAHELGHVALGHLGHAPILGTDVSEEYEANEFAHYLLRRPLAARMADWYRARRRQVRLAAACLLLLAAGAALWLFFQPKKPGLTRIPAVTRDDASDAADRNAGTRQQADPARTDAETTDPGTALYGEYYCTPSGKKFHRKDCSFLDDAFRNGTARRLTVEDYESGRYTPCSRCLPDFTPETEAP